MRENKSSKVANTEFMEGMESENKPIPLYSIKCCVIKRVVDG